MGGVRDVLAEVVRLAEAGRPGFAASVGLGADTLDPGQLAAFPATLAEMYAVLAGTERPVPDERLMDVVPGRRLMHRAEAPAAAAALRNAWPDLRAHWPFTADYAGCHHVFDVHSGEVLDLAPELGPATVAASLERYWATVLECYRAGICFVGPDGYLDSDADSTTTPAVSVTSPWRRAADQMTNYTIERRTMEPRHAAVVRDRLRWSELGANLLPLLDRVYAAVKAGRVVQTGQNIFIYRDPTKDGVSVEIGVEVAGPFPATDGVAYSATPEGEVAVTTHRGAYAQLGAAHDAVIAWCAANGRERTGVSWEVYGDWREDPADLETEVCYALRARANPR
jgi:effector-binding domain-containing protein